MSDQEMTWATTGFDKAPRPNAFIQWKGTDVCLDFHCECGYTGHFDGGFAYGLRCAGCGKIWQMPHTVGLILDRDSSDGAAVQDTDWPHDGRRPYDNPRIGEPE